MHEWTVSAHIVRWNKNQQCLYTRWSVRHTEHQTWFKTWKSHTHAENRHWCTAFHLVFSDTPNCSPSRSVRLLYGSLRFNHLVYTVLNLIFELGWAFPRCSCGSVTMWYTPWTFPMQSHWFGFCFNKSSMWTPLVSLLWTVCSSAWTAQCSVTRL